MTDAFFTSGDLLEMEEKSNEVLRNYSKLYFNDALSSAYFFETNENGFGACFLIKSVDGDSSWDSIHTFTVEGGDYSLVSTVFLQVGFTASGTKASVAGTCTKKTSKNVSGTSSNGEKIAIMGRMMEINESDIRSEMDDIYVGKTQQIVNTGRLGFQ